MAHSKRHAFQAHFKLHRMAGVAGAVAAALFVADLPAMAQPASDPAHAIANRFAEDATRAEAQRKEAARKKAREEAAKAARAKAQKAYEAEMLRRARAEAEERRKLEEEAARLDAIRIEREAREAKAAEERAEKDRQIEAAKAAEKARLAEEAHKAEEAKRAAEALRIAAEQAAAEEARKAEAAKRAEIARQAEEEARRAETRRLAEEARRAEQAAWAAEETRRAEAARKAEEIRKAEEVRKADEVRRVAAEQAARAEAEKHAAEAQRTIARATAEETRRVADIEAEAEIARVAERLHRIREEHLAQRTGIATDQTPGSAADAIPAADSLQVAGPVVDAREQRLLEPSSGRARIGGYDERRDVPLQPPRTRKGSAPPAYQDPEPKRAFDGHVAVLLQMEPRYRRGRRYESMDPVLCTSEGCYVSNGPEESASFLYGHGATRFGNAISRRAGACNHAYTCVFRNVDVGKLPVELQPVDIRIIRHDRRAPEWVEALSRCRVTAGGRLACTGAIEGDGYTMWVISEAEAEDLPPHALDNALGAGLVDGERAAADPKLMGPRERW